MKFRKIKKDDLLPPQKAIREAMDGKKYTALLTSIKEHGILEPLIVRQSGENFEVVCGHRRFIVGLELDLQEFPCMIRECVDADALIEKYHENAFREDLSVHEEAQLFNSLKTMENMEVEKIAKEMNRNPSYIKSRLELLNYPPEIIEAVKTKEITLSIAQELSFVPDDSTRGTYLNQCIIQKANLARVRIWVGGWLRNNDPEKHKERENIYGKADNPNPNIPCQLCRAEIRISELKQLLTCPACFEAIHSMVQSSIQEAQETIKKDSQGGDEKKE